MYQLRQKWYINNNFEVCFGRWGPSMDIKNKNRILNISTSNETLEISTMTRRGKSNKKKKTFHNRKGKYNLGAKRILKRASCSDMDI